MLSEEEFALLERLAPDMRSAFSRLAVPFLRRSPVLEQVVQEQRLGAVVVTASGTVREHNEPAVRMLQRFASELGLLGRFTIAGAVERALAWPVSSAHGQRCIRKQDGMQLWIAEHVLDAGPYDLPEPLRLLVFRSPTPTVAWLHPSLLSQLRPRERDIALLLVTTGMTYAEIGGELRIATGTVRTHVARIYSTLGVGSRAELARKFQGEASEAKMATNATTSRAGWGRDR